MATYDSKQPLILTAGSEHREHQVSYEVNACIYDEFASGTSLHMVDPHLSIKVAWNASALCSDLL
jgi:hypothetical protein